MTPDGWGSALAFLLFVAPGIVFDLLSRRRRAGVDESAFREASRVALSSLVFSLLAALLVVPRASRSPIVVRAARAVEAGGLSWLSSEGLALLGVAVAQLVLSCVLAFGWHSVLRLIGHGGNIVLGSAWTRVFRLDLPDDHEGYVLAKLTSGAVWAGRVLSFSPDLELDHRELVLGQPLSIETASGDMADVPSDFQRVVLRATEISTLTVMYKRDREVGGVASRWARMRGTLAAQLRALARWVEGRP